MSGILFGLLMSRDAAEARATRAQAQRDAAEARATRAQAQRDAAETAQRESQYRSLVDQLREIRQLPHANGWSVQAWDLAQQAAAIHRDKALRDQTAATLAGIDAQPGKRPGKGRRHLGGLRPGGQAVGDRRSGTVPESGLPRQDPGPHQRQPAGLVRTPGAGPVVFRDDDTPLQFVARPEGGLVLWDLEHRCAVANFEVPGGGTPTSLALQTDGSTVAASVSQSDGQGKMQICGRGIRASLRNQFAGKATALAFSENGELLAAGEEDGRIRVWTMSNGRMLAELPQGRVTIHCWGFTRGSTTGPRWEARVVARRRRLRRGDRCLGPDFQTSHRPLHGFGLQCVCPGLLSGWDDPRLRPQNQPDHDSLGLGRPLESYSHCSSSLSLDSGLAFSAAGGGWRPDTSSCKTRCSRRFFSGSWSSSADSNPPRLDRPSGSGALLTGSTKDRGLVP